jgi:hypothetical protein
MCDVPFNCRPGAEPSPGLRVSSFKFVVRGPQLLGGASVFASRRTPNPGPWLARTLAPTVNSGPGTWNSEPRPRIRNPKPLSQRAFGHHFHPSPRIQSPRETASPRVSPPGQTAPSAWSNRFSPWSQISRAGRLEPQPGQSEAFRANPSKSEQIRGGNILMTASSRSSGALV